MPTPLRCLPLLFLLFAASCAVKPIIPPSDTLDPQNHADILKNVLQHGDWLVTRGVHGADNFVATVTRMPFSHASIYDAEHDGVIEAEGVGVHRTPLEEFITKSQRILVIRPMWATGENMHGAVQRARNWIGKGYNFTGLAGLGTPDRYYCSQLCIEAYRPFITENPDNPIPLIVPPGNMYFWGRILYDSGP